MRGVADLPVLIVAAGGPDELAAAVADLAGDLADALVEGVEDTGDGGGGAARCRWRTGRWRC